MTPKPEVLGLTLSDHVIVEEGTRKISIIGTFTRIVVGQTPSRPVPFCVFASLSDGLGEGKIALRITRLQTDVVVYAQELPIRFSTKLAEVQVLFRVNRCSFPDAGWYDVTLLVDGECSPATTSSPHRGGDGNMNPEAKPRPDWSTDNLTSTIVIADGPEDTTPRPRPADTPRCWPADVPFPWEGSPKPPESTEK